MDFDLVMRPGLSAELAGRTIDRSTPAAWGPSAYVPPPVVVPLTPTFGAPGTSFQVLVYFNRPVVLVPEQVPGYIFNPGAFQRTVDNLIQLQPNLVKLILTDECGDGPYQVTVPANDPAILDESGNPVAAGSYLFLTGS